MSRTSAFADPAGRHRLLADVSASGPMFQGMVNSEAHDADLASLCAQSGLHPALIRLLPTLSASGNDSMFCEALFRAIRQGTDTGNLARQILLMAWTDPVYGRSRLVPAGAVLDACEEIIALVHRALTVSVDRKVWRSARSELVQAHQGGTAIDATVDLVLSLGWDIDQSPGAAHDVMSAWARIITQDAEATDEDCFSEEEAALFDQTIERINSEAILALTDADGAMNADIDAFLAEAGRRWALDPVTQALKDRAIARRDRTQVRIEHWRKTIQQAMLGLARPPGSILATPGGAAG